MGRRSIQLKKIEGDASEPVVINKVDLAAMSWSELYSIAKLKGVAVYPRGRKEIEHDLNRVLADE